MIKYLLVVALQHRHIQCLVSPGLQDTAREPNDLIIDRGDCGVILDDHDKRHLLVPLILWAWGEYGSR